MPLRVISLLLAAAATTHAFEFQPGQEITSYVGRVPEMHPADLDSDGDLDLVTRSSQTIQIFENSGAGSFERGALWGASGGEILKAVADFDDDGTPDLLLANSGPDNGLDPAVVRILYGSGLAGYGPRETALGVFVDAWFQLKILDVDGSGKPDLILTDRVIVDPARGLPLEEVFPEGLPSTTLTQSFMNFGDWTGDGLPDALVALSRIEILENLGDGKFAAKEELPLSETFDLGDSAIEHFHVVRDPRLRSGRGLVVVLAEFAGFDEIAYRMGLVTEDASGALELSHVVPISLPSDPTVTFMGFTQEPGKPLLACWHDWDAGRLTEGSTSVVEVGIKVRRGAPQLVTTTRARFPRGARPIRQADMDDDGIDDLLVSGLNRLDPDGGELHYRRGNRKGSFAAKPVAITPAATSDTVTHVTDFEGDGDQDLIARGFSATAAAEEIALWENDGDGNLSRRVILPGLLSPELISVADRNGDVRADLLVSSLTAKRDGNLERKVQLSLSGKGQARRVLTLIREAADRPWRVKAGDWDGDGIDDLLLWEKMPDGLALASPVRWVKGLPGHRFGAPLPLGSSLYETLQDMDGDGDLDLVASRELLRYENVQTGWRENTGAGTEPVPHAFPDLDGAEGSQVLVSAEADFNQDGRIDLLLSAYSYLEEDACVPVILGAGVTFTEWAPLPTGTPWFHDMDADGDTDVILTTGVEPRYQSSSMSVLENIAGDSFAAAVAIGESTFADWNPVLAGDLDGDGEPDIVGSTVSGRPRIEWFKAE